MLNKGAYFWCDFIDEAVPLFLLIKAVCFFISFMKNIFNI